MVNLFLFATLIVVIFWRYMVRVYASWTWVAFWAPVKSGEWRGIHLLAHWLGGGLIALFLRGPWFSPHWVDAIWKRGIWILLFQALWERIQVENWRPSVWGLSTYPWASAIWDVLVTVSAWAFVEGIFALLR